MAAAKRLPNRNAREDDFSRIDGRLRPLLIRAGKRKMCAASGKEAAGALSLGGWDKQKKQNE